MIAKDPDGVGATHKRIREDRASGTLELVAVDRPNLIVKERASAEKLAKAGASGHFFVWDDFVRAKLQGQNFKDVAEATEYIENVMGYKTGVGETGDCGVFVSSMPMGASYYYEEGMG